MPIYKVRHGVYKITHNNANLTHIPGLQYDETNATGSIDAIAIASARCGGQSSVNSDDTPRNKANNALRDYQNYGVDWLTNHLRTDGAAILADDMGLGKTTQSIHAAITLGVTQTLVICPGAVRETWRKELLKWHGIEATVVTTGAQAEKVDSTNVWVVCSYELVAKLSISPNLVIIDEMQNVRGRVTKRGTAILDLCTQAEYRIGLTGTPMWSRPRDLWMLLKILFRYRFGNANDFDFAYCGAFINEWGGKVNKAATRSDELRKRLSYVMLRREKRDVAKDLPQLTIQTEWVEADKTATRLFQRAIMRKAPGDTSEALKATLVGKMDRAIQLAIEAQRFLLFTWMKEHASTIHAKLIEAGVPCNLITGDMSQAKRNAAIEAAKSNKCGVVATIDAAGTGVDGLQHVANIGIFHALDYVPLKMAQAVARLDRIGQTMPVHWTFLAMQESLDVLVVNTIVNKLDQWRGLFGNDSNKGLRDSLGDSVNGAGAEAAEKAALALLYEEM